MIKRRMLKISWMEQVSKGLEKNERKKKLVFYIEKWQLKSVNIKLSKVSFHIMAHNVERELRRFDTHRKKWRQAGQNKTTHKRNGWIVKMDGRSKCSRYNIKKKKMRATKSSHDRQHTEDEDLGCNIHLNKLKMTETVIL